MTEPTMYQTIEVIQGDPQHVVDELTREFSDGEMHLTCRVKGNVIELDVAYPGVDRNLAAERMRHWITRAAETAHSQIHWRDAAL